MGKEITGSNVKFSAHGYKLDTEMANLTTDQPLKSRG